MALLEGAFASDLIEFACERLGTKRGIPLSVALLGLVLSPSLLRDLPLDRLLLQPNTGALARPWIQRHVPPLTLTAATDYDPIWNGLGEPQLPSIYRFVPMQTFRSLPARNIYCVFSESLPELAKYSPGPTSAEQAALNSEAALLLKLKPAEGRFTAFGVRSN